MFNNHAWVPIGSFALSVVMALLTGPVKPPLWARVAGSETHHKCKVKLTHLDGTLNASGWLHNEIGSANEITAKGDYETVVNTPTQDLDERLQIFIKLTLTFAPESMEAPFTGSAFGTLKHIAKPGLAGAPDPDTPLHSTIDFLLNGNGTDDLDNAITDVVNQVALSDPEGAGAIAKTDIITNLKAALTARVKVDLAGSLEGMTCKDTISAQNTLSFDDGGNALKEKKLVK